MAQYFEVVGQINSQQVNDNIQYVITQQEISPQTFRPPQQVVQKIFDVNRSIFT